MSKIKKTVIEQLKPQKETTMSKIKKTAAAALTLAALGLIALSAPAGAGPAADAPAGIAVDFQRDKLIEVALLSVEPGKEEQLNEYFAQVMPIAAEYGMRPLATLAVQTVPVGELRPQMIGFFEWPSIEQRTAFEGDPRFRRIKGIRDDSLSFLTFGYFKVESDTTVTFQADRLYEVYSLWIDPENADQLQTYFEQVGATAGELGARFPLSLSPITSSLDDYRPDSLGIAEWPDEEAYRSFFDSDVFKRSSHLREAALDAFHVFHARIITE